MNRPVDPTNNMCNRSIASKDVDIVTPQDLLDAQIFEVNWDGKPARVIRGLLQTAVEHPQSEVALFMKFCLPVAPGQVVFSREVVVALSLFAERQYQETGDKSWVAVHRALEGYSSGKGDPVITEAVFNFLRAYSDEGR